MADEPRHETRRHMADDERQADFERRITDYSTLPPKYLAEIQRRIRQANEEDRQAS